MAKTGEQLDEESGSLRTCIVTRARHSPDSMIRFVLDPSGAVVPDIKRKLPGRGVWTLASSSVVDEAVRKKAFSRAFRQPVETPADLSAMVDQQLLRDALQSLAMANKAGLAVAGAFQVQEALATSPVAVLFQASDGSAGGLSKMRQAARRGGGGDGPEPGETVPAKPLIVDFLNSDQIGLALGRTNVIHAALKPGPASNAFAARCRRLASFRSEGLLPDGAEQLLEGGGTEDTAKAG